MLHNTWKLKVGCFSAKVCVFKDQATTRRFLHVQHRQALLTCLCYTISDIITVVGGLQLEVLVGGGGGLGPEHLVQAAGPEVVARAAVSSFLLLPEHIRALSWGSFQQEKKSCVA